MTTRYAVVREARSWLRTPFGHRQQLKGCGVDCAHLLTGVYEPLQLIEIVDMPWYPRDWFLHCKREDGTLYADILDKHMVRVAQAELGDVVGLRYGRCRVAHAGIVVSDEWMVAATPAGVGLVEWKHGDVAGRVTDAWSPRSWHV